MNKNIWKPNDFPKRRFQILLLKRENFDVRIYDEIFPVPVMQKTISVFSIPAPVCQGATGQCSGPALLRLVALAPIASR